MNKSVVGLRLVKPLGVRIEEAKVKWKVVLEGVCRGRGIEPCKETPLLKIEMPCGEAVAYERYEDIPEGDVRCPCGDEGHWIIKHEVAMSSKEGEEVANSEFMKWFFRYGERECRVEGCYRWTVERGKKCHRAFLEMCRGN
uniref:Uncharacterized protein n=1 Tax=viral metagenome TaxID=1070528 RepID=A0A6H1ZFW3_9ZZZZ